MIFRSLIATFIMRGELPQKDCIAPFWKGNKPVCPFSNSSFTYVNKETIEITETLFDLFDDDIISCISNIDLDVCLHTLQNHL